MLSAKALTSEDSNAVLFICVNYHSEADVRALVGDLLGQRVAGRVDVIIVDNGGGEAATPPLSALSLAHAQVAVVTPPSNLGYFGGADYGLKLYLKNNGIPDWVAVSNPDIRIRNKGFFEELLLNYSGESVPAVIAPRLQSLLSGTDQNPYLRHRPSRIRMHFYRWLFALRPAARWYERVSLAKFRTLLAISKFRRKRPLPVVKPEAIYAPHGSLMFFHHSYFSRGGNLCHGSFLFGEEIFVGETARKLGCTVIYDPRLAAEHRQKTPSTIIHDSTLARYASDSAAFLAREFF